MGWSMANKIFPFVPRHSDKLAEKSISKKINKMPSEEKQLDTIKELLIKEFQEKYFWKEEVDKVRLEGNMRALLAFEYIVKRTIDWVKKDFILIPKSSSQD